MQRLFYINKYSVHIFLNSLHNNTLFLIDILLYWYVFICIPACSFILTNWNLFIIKAQRTFVAISFTETIKTIAPERPAKKKRKSQGENLVFPRWVSKSWKVVNDSWVAKLVIPQQLFFVNIQFLDVFIFESIRF